ncbi:hypothetical protein [Pseudomonas xantholysinigenes]|jgi:hypothetical protein|uniref:DUF2846 domain-containing protein n=1 Tax=Pseudomonas xantholysinigenes TaxID=2745490 RepID=A0A9E6TYS3_9PSED|nr:hypothetical protein [Pseudomonas xantholysinigenes]QXI40763.1 hypothetical protein HU772_012055 [Pseudomonas xantholysinigenes]
MFTLYRAPWVCLLLLGAGCAQMPAEMALDSPVYSASNAGLVVGSLNGAGPYGTWLEFRDEHSAKTFGWAAKDYYSAWLPAGTYQVSSLGSRRGTMGAFGQPLRFTVQAGQINYLGELVNDCSYPVQPTAYYGVMACGPLALGTCTVPRASVGLCVVDRQKQALRTFLKAQPRFAELPVRPALMGTR